MKIVVSESDIRGKGVFATAPIAIGEVVHQMAGERVGLLTCALRIATRRTNFDDPLPISNDTFIILDQLSNRFNHSCAPNAALRGEGEMFAIAPIAIDDEITFDYSTTMRRSFYSRLWTMPCNCGAKSCRGSIGDVATIPKAQIENYVRKGALQDFMLASLGVKAPLTQPSS